LRVAHYTGPGDDVEVHTFGSPPDAPKGADLALYAQYMAPGVFVPAGMPGGVN
jgi:hypothetical protein